ncbi:MAG: IS66 family transposase [Anaerovoracaceae bacterium]|jgi:transposase
METAEAKGSNIGKALDYLLGQEKYLRRFLEDARIPLDNNLAEQTIKPFCIGKKNWMMIDTAAGGDSSAIIYSLAETAKANNLNPYEYLKHLPEVLLPNVEETEMDFPDDLMPWSDALPEVCRKPVTTDAKEA